MGKLAILAVILGWIGMIGLMKSKSSVEPKPKPKPKQKKGYDIFFRE